jgi:hypothetical protein
MYVTTLDPRASYTHMQRNQGRERERDMEVESRPFVTRRQMIGGQIADTAHSWCGECQMNDEEAEGEQVAMSAWSHRGSSNREQMAWLATSGHSIPMASAATYYICVYVYVYVYVYTPSTWVVGTNVRLLLDFYSLTVAICDYVCWFKPKPIRIRGTNPPFLPLIPTNHTS